MKKASFFFVKILIVLSFVGELIKLNPLENIFIISITIILGSFIFGQNKKIKNILLAVLVSMFVVFTIKNLDRKLLINSDLEKLNINNRQAYFVKDFGQFYSNRIGIFLLNDFRPVVYKFGINIGSKLDIHNYFTSERLLTFIVLPFFLYGFIKIVEKTKRKSFITILLLIFISGFIKNEGLGLIMYLPFVYTFSFNGIYS